MTQTDTMDALVQPKLNEVMWKEDAQLETRSHVKLASTHAGEDRHWVIVPPSATTPLVAIPPGTVRGVWKKPGFTPSDQSKTVTIEGSYKDVKVGGTLRGLLQWGDDCPADVTHGHPVCRPDGEDCADR